MKRTRTTLAAVCLALGAAALGWLALRAGAARERSAAPIEAPVSVPDVRPSAELASPAGEAAAEGRAAVASAPDAARREPAPATRATAALAMPNFRPLVFFVQDTAGAPLAGATASALRVSHGNGTWPSVADAEGRGEIMVEAGACALRFAAAGYETVEVPIPPDEGSLVVILRSATALEVRLPPGAAELGVELLANETPFVKDGKGSWSPDPEPGGTSATALPKGTLRLRADGNGADFATDPDPESKGSVTFWGAAGGVYVLTGVRPGLALTLVVVDAYGFPILERKVAPLDAGERRIVELAPALPTGRLAGRVLSADGGPALGAEVSIGPVGRPPVKSSMTDGNGDFRLEGIAAQRVRLKVSHVDHARLLLPEQPVTEVPLELVLERGRTVRVVVRGPEGDLVPKAAASLSGRFSRVDVHPHATAAAIVFEHAPSEELALRVTFAGRSTERSIAPGSQDEAVDVEVPAGQSCTVLLTGALGSAPGSLTLHLEGDGHVMQRSLGGGQDSARFAVLFPGTYEAFAVALVDGKETRWSATATVEIAPQADATVALELRAP